MMLTSPSPTTMKTFGFGLSWGLCSQFLNFCHWWLPFLHSLLSTYPAHPI